MLRKIETHINASVLRSVTSPISVPIASVKPSSFNVRTHSKRQLRQIQGSMRRFGQTSFPLVDENNVLIAGHARLAAWKALGNKSIAVLVITGLSDTEKRALALADNKIHDNSENAKDKLFAELSYLAPLLTEFDLTLEDLGFSAFEFDSLSADFATQDEPIDAVPAPSDRPAISAEGDIWILHDHRIACGSSGIAINVTNLFGARRARAIFTDPPYNVKISSRVGRGTRKHREFLQGSGELSKTEFTEFLTEKFRCSAAVLLPNSVVYACMDYSHMEEIQTAGSSAFGPLLNVAVWVKNNAGHKGGIYRNQHEFVFVFTNGNDRSDLSIVRRTRSNVWDYARVNSFDTGATAELSLHPTVKPIPLVSDAILDCTRRGDIVYDPFLGSGTTIIAAEKTGRIGYGMEIDPLYVDVAVRRWQAFTKADAILESTGQTFDELAEGAPRRVRRRR